MNDALMLISTAPVAAFYLIPLTAECDVFAFRGGSPKATGKVRLPGRRRGAIRLSSPWRPGTGC